MEKRYTKIRVRYGSGRCDQFSSVGSSKIKIRTSSWHKAQSDFFHDGVRILIFEKHLWSMCFSKCTVLSNIQVYSKSVLFTGRYRPRKPARRRTVWYNIITLGSAQNCTKNKKDRRLLQKNTYFAAPGVSSTQSSRGGTVRDRLFRIRKKKHFINRS